MSNILSRSPYIKEITDANLEAGTIKIFLWTPGTSTPALPQYTLSKLTPASNVDSVYFDIAPYVNEYINNKNYSPNSFYDDIDLPVQNYCNVQLYYYKTVGGVTSLISSEGFYGFKGYLEQKNSINTDNGNYLLDQAQTYYYHYDAVNFSHAGDVTAYLFSSYSIKYTDLKTGATHTISVATTGWKKLYKVYTNYKANGNYLEIYSGPTLLAIYIFRPITECRYSPVTLDFVNKYGAWQREFLFKNSIESINVDSQQYKNYRINPTTFDAQENLLTTFNTNGTESIKCNTGFVDESFSKILQQLLLSDRILINNRPATITTKQVELQKNINNKLINYSLDFQFSNSII